MQAYATVTAVEIRRLKMGHGNWAIETLCASFLLDVLQLCLMGAWSEVGRVVTGKAVLFVVGIWACLVVDSDTSPSMCLEWWACGLLTCQHVRRPNICTYVLYICIHVYMYKYAYIYIYIYI